MVTFLQIASSLIFFIQKMLTLAGKKSGWLVGVIAATLALIYFCYINLWVYVTLEVGLIILMVYGFFKENKNPRVERFVRITTMAVMLSIAMFGSGVMTTVELGSSFGLLGGMYFLTHGKPKIGWFLSMIGHGLGAAIGYDKEQYWFMFFQVASVIVSRIGTLIGVLQINEKPR